LVCISDRFCFMSVSNLFSFASVLAFASGISFCLCLFLFVLSRSVAFFASDCFIAMLLRSVSF
jgi:hypothetical protein